MGNIGFGSLVKKRIRGFSLMETALALIIMGIVATLTLPLLASSQKYHRYQLTEKHQAELMRVFAGYAMSYSKLPLPSLPPLQGYSVVYAETEEHKILKGIVPYKELGIPEEIAKDGYGNWFTYVVVRALTKNAEGNSSLEERMNRKLGREGYCYVPKPLEGIKLYSLKGTPVLNLEKMENDFIAFILISHGAAGTGAFHVSNNEQLDVPEENIYEKCNTINTDVFYTRISDDEEPLFKHKVYWVTRNNLMAIYGKYPCPSLPSIDLLTPPNASAEVLF